MVTPNPDDFALFRGLLYGIPLSLAFWGVICWLAGWFA